MSVFTSIWDGLKLGLEAILRMYEGLLEPLAGSYAWAISIVLLTLTVRLFLVPLAVRQTKSMRAMQRLQPELKKIQKKYEVDRSLIKTDPERYKALKEKQREAQMALYQEHSVNPVGGCLPLLLQMPIFFALFSVLRTDGEGVAQIPELTGAGFFGIDSLTNTAASGAGIGAIVLVVLQVWTTYYSTKQMSARNTTAAPEQQQVQKIMLYIMPVFLGYLSWTFPIGVVLYWVTTNVWTIGQQAIIFRQVEAQEARAEEERAAAREQARAERRKRTGGGGGSRDAASGGSKGKGAGSSTSAGSDKARGAGKAKDRKDGETASVAGDSDDSPDGAVEGRARGGRASSASARARTNGKATPRRDATSGGRPRGNAPATGSNGTRAVGGEETTPRRTRRPSKTASKDPGTDSA